MPQYINDALPLGKPDMVGLNIYNAAPAQMGENGPSYVERPAGYAHTAMNWAGGAGMPELGSPPDAGAVRSAHVHHRKRLVLYG